MVDTMRNLFISLMLFSGSGYAQNEFSIPSGNEDSLHKKTSQRRYGVQSGFGMMNFGGGYCLGMDYGYFPIDFIGIGIKGSMFQNKKSEIKKAQHLIYYYRAITTYFIAPVITLSLPGWDKEFYAFSNISYGLVAHEQFVAAKNYSATYSGITPGISIDLGIDWQILNRRYIGLVFSAMAAVLKKHTLYSITDAVFFQPINISRIDISLAYRFY